MHRRLFATLLAAASPQIDQFDQFDGRPKVLVANWVGPNGELVLFARDSQCRMVGEPMLVPHGADRFAASEALWDRLAEAERPHLTLLPPSFT